MYNHVSRRTIYVKMTGILSEEEMRRVDEALRRTHNAYANEVHLIVADMRGMKTLSPRGRGPVLGEPISYGRKRGVFTCVHLSDDTVVRLQMLRLARQVSEGDDVTVDVVSLEEAEKVLAEKRVALMSQGHLPSSRRGTAL